MLDLISFWMFAWVVRSFIEVSPATVTGVIGFAASYYVAARLVFPTDPEAFTDLDDHFYRVRRVVLGILIALVFVQWAYLTTQVDLAVLSQNPTSIALTVLLVALMGAGMIWRKDAINIAILAALNARYLALYLLF
jgi:hypothetical protein